MLGVEEYRMMMVEEMKKKSARCLLDSSLIALYGTLKKYNPKGKPQTRLCIIHAGTFFYFKDACSPKPRGFFGLAGYQAYKTENVSLKHTFQVDNINTNHRTYTFSCLTEKDRDNWISILNQHVLQQFPVSLRPGTVAPCVPQRTPKMEEMYRESLKNPPYGSFSDGVVITGDITELAASRGIGTNGRNKMTDSYVTMDKNDSAPNPLPLRRFCSTTSSQASSEDPYLKVFYQSGESDGESEDILANRDAIINAHMRNAKTSSINKNIEADQPGSIDSMPHKNKHRQPHYLSSPKHLSFRPSRFDHKPIPKPRVSRVSSAALPPPIPVRGVKPIQKSLVLQCLATSDVLPESCHIAGVAKNECCQLLCQSEVGTYFVRTEREDGNNALAVLAEVNPAKVKHYIVFKSTSDGRLYLNGEEPRFSEFQDLLKHYYVNYLPQTELILSQPLLR